MGIKLVEQCMVSPSHGGGEQILPLLHFDVVWLPVQPTQILNLYNFPSSNQHFFTTTLPNLKKSLSLALKHFLPLAGNIVFPLNSAMPVSHYNVHDSVSLTVAVSDSDFNLLTGNHPKNADEFHDFIPQMPPATYSSDSDSIKFAPLSLRVTLFPNQGICIGIALHHAVCDGTNILGPFGLMQTWASINKLGGDDDSHLRHHQTLPSYDRSTVQDAAALTALVWNHVKAFKPAPCSAISLPTGKLRATFLLTDVEIQGLKRFLLMSTNQNPAVDNYVSSYVVICAHVWSCLALAASAGDGERVGEDEAEYLSMYVDCRKRLNPPLADTYFGNCLVLVLAESTHGRLVEGLKPGFLAAARAIGAAMKRRMGGGIMKGAEEEYFRRMKVADKRMVGVSGSPGFDLFSADYGWGRMRKMEALHIDHNGSMFLSKSNGGGGGVEIGLSMPKVNMDAFASIFNKKSSIIINININSSRL